MMGLCSGVTIVSIRAPVTRPERLIRDLEMIKLELFQSALRSRDRSDLAPPLN